ncbi:MAG TPA: hypothetical protein VK176_11400 [Phycisphaerales bacterium]|nr:hypothetical protein [Phycisphaerales bacterium]
MKSKMMCVAAVAACAGGAAQGAIVSSGGAVDVIAAPADARLNVLTDSARIRAWDEQQDVELTSAVAYDASAPGIYNMLTDLGNFTLAAGQRVSSHYIHFDSPGSTAASAEGTVTFAGVILAVICRGDNSGDLLGKLDSSDYLGAPTLYSDNVEARGMELATNGDRFVISPDGKSIGVKFGITTPGDYVRVLTVVPAPGAACLAGLSILGCVRRRR